MLKLKLQYFGHLMQIANSLEKDSDAGKDRRQEEKGTTEDEMLDGVISTMDMSLRNLGDNEGRGAWHVAVHGWQRAGHH